MAGCSDTLRPTSRRAPLGRPLDPDVVAIPIPLRRGMVDCRLARLLPTSLTVRPARVHRAADSAPRRKAPRCAAHRPRRTELTEDHGGSPSGVPRRPLQISLGRIPRTREGEPGLLHASRQRLHLEAGTREHLHGRYMHHAEDKRELQRMARSQHSAEGGGLPLEEIDIAVRHRGRPAPPPTGGWANERRRRSRGRS